MADELVPMRQAMGEAYIGDTIMAKQLFASPATFDQRVISLLSGLGQAAETPTAQAISGDDLKAVMGALHPTDNAQRLALIDRLIERNSSQYESFLIDNRTAFSLTKMLLSSGPFPFLHFIDSGAHIAPDATLRIKRHPLRGGMFDFRIPFVNPFLAPSGDHITGNRFKFGFIVPDGETYHLPFVGVSRQWIPCSFVRSSRSEIKQIPNYCVEPIYETFDFGGSLGVKNVLTFTVSTTAGAYLNWTDLWTNGSFDMIDGAISTLSFSFTAM